MSLLKIDRFFKKTRDILITDMMYTFPFAVKWLYRTFIKQQITSYILKNTLNSTTHTACLYLHGDIRLQMNQGTFAVLLLHGMHGHPLTMLHLADIAQRMSVPVFSLHLHYHVNQPEIHRSLLTQAMNEIERLVKENGSPLQGIVMAGHSQGAIESAYRAFVKEDERIASVISIAGRLKVVPSLDKACPESIKTTVESIYQDIQKNSNLPLYQIVAGNDWNAPFEAMVVRHNEECFHLIETAMHFNILFHQETRSKFGEFLKKSIS